MKEYKCPNCGGTINPATGTCGYCGSRFESTNDDIIRIETYQNPIKVYQSSMVVEDEMLRAISPDGVSQIAIRNLSHNLADAIAENMEIRTEYDPRLMTQRISAMVRIVKPKHLF